MSSPPTATSTCSTWVADAEHYDHWFESSWGAYAFTTERQAVLHAAGNLAGKRVADIGCGTGRFTTHLDRDAGHVIGLDPDPSMLAIASRRTQAPLVLGDGHRLPFIHHCFDLAIAVTVCEFATDPAAVVTELVRITRPGGRVVVGALNRDTHGESPTGTSSANLPGMPPGSCPGATCTYSASRTAPCTSTLGCTRPGPCRSSASGGRPSIESAASSRQELGRSTS